MDKLKLSDLSESIERHGVTPMLDEDSVVMLIEIAQAALKWDRSKTALTQAEALNGLHRLLAKVDL